MNIYDISKIIDAGTFYVTHRSLSAVKEALLITDRQERKENFDNLVR